MEELKHQNISYCEVPGELSFVSSVAEHLREFCELRLIDTTIWPAIELGFCEALNNAIEHGCRGFRPKSVKVMWQWEEEQLTIEIEDPGNFKHLPKAARLPDDPLSESGRGCFLIESIFDSAVHSKTQYGHKLVLMKTLHRPKSPIAKIQELYETLQSTTNDLSQSYSELDALQGFAEDLSREPWLAETVSSSLARLQSVFNIPHAAVWVLQKGHLINPLDHKEQRFELTSNHSISIVQALRTHREQIIVDCTQFARSDPLYSVSDSALLVPISYQDEFVGIISLQMPKQDAIQLETRIARLTRAISRFLAIAIENASTINQKKEHARSKTELEIAAEIQQSLLPSKFPSNEHFRLTGKCVTALAVGGDYIDAIEIKGRGLLLVIADVMGKGVPAALLATIFRTAIRSRLNLAETPGWLLSQTNKQIYEELGHLNMFITAQVAYYSYDDYRLKLASAGHCPAFLSRNGLHGPEEICSEGVPLGINPDDVYDERLIQLGAKDRIVFITDGIYEVENQSGEMLGINGFSKRLPEIWQEGIEAVPENALSVVDAHSQGGSAQDDKTLMALEIL